MKRVVLAAALLLFAAAARSQLAFGPERAAAAPEPETPAAWTATTAASASGSLVVFRPNFSVWTYAQLLDRNGDPLTPGGIRLTTRMIDVGGVASDGTNYMIIWTEQAAYRDLVKTVWTLAVSATGDVSSPRLLGQAYTTAAARIASNGRGYFATWIAITEDNRSEVRGRALDADGAPVGSELALSDSLAPLSYRPRFADDAVASDGRDYLVAFVDRLAFVDGQYSPQERPVTFVPVAGGVPGAAKSTPLPLETLVHSFTGPNYMLGWYDSVNAYIASVAPDGTVGVRRPIGGGEVQSMAGTRWGALAIANQRGGQTTGVYAVRFTTGALPIDRRKLGDDVESRYAAGATAADDYVAVTLAYGPMNLALLPPGQVDPPPPLLFRPLVQFATRQQSPAIITNGGTEVLAWSEASAIRVTRMRDGVPLDTPPLSVAADTDAVTLASGGGRTLILWQEPERELRARPWSAGCRIVGSFLDADGTVSPAFTIVSPECSQAVDSTLQQAVWNGKDFVMLWSVRPSDGGARLWRTSVDRNGKITIPAAPLDLAATPSSPPAAVPASDGFLLFYEELNRRHELFIASFDRDAAPIGPPRPLAASVDDELRPALASDGRGHLLAAYAVKPAGGEWSLWTIPLDEHGNPTAAATPLGQSSGARVWWTGTAFLVIESYGNQAALVDVGGRIVAPLLPVFESKFTLAGAGNTIAYIRHVDDDERGDVDRVVVRTLIGPRRRAARR